MSHELATKALQSAASDLELADAGLSTASDLIKGAPGAASSPHQQLRFGQLRARFHAAHGLLSRAMRLHELARSTDSEGTIANIVALQVQAFARDLTYEIYNELTALGGSSSIDWQSRGYRAPAPDRPNELIYERIGRHYLQ